MIAVTELSYRHGTFSLQEVSFSVPQGAYAVLMGATGSGKTTLVELICGLKNPQRGKIELSGRNITHLSPGQRRIGYVPQDGALFPTLSVREQIEFAPKLKKLPPSALKELTDRLAESIGITPLLQRSIHGLSGGEKQRIALARALAAEPEVLILDEPLSAVDEESREALMTLLQTTHQQRKLTVLHITHHRHEAQTLATVQLRLENSRVIPHA